MSSDLPITAMSDVGAADASGLARAPASAVAPVVTANAATATANATPNPTLELNAALGLVMIQFHNEAGAVTSSIPTQQQIDVYRLWQET
jgi:hypothetical protein